MKTCCTCGEAKPFDCFGLRKQSRDGRKSECQDCLNAKSKERYQRMRDKKLAYAASYRAANKEVALARTRKWRKSSAEKIAEYGKAYREANAAHIKARHANFKKRHKARYTEIQRRRNAALAVPAWADKQDISMWYEVAEVLSRSGVEFHVDHSVPLKGKTVCGLHTHDNLTVIPWHENLAKKNVYWPDMP